MTSLGRTTKRLLRTVMACALAAVWTQAVAKTIAEMEHTVWGGKEGVTGAVIWVDDTPSGMLLLRTTGGYQVFDGVEFHSFSRDKPLPFTNLAEVLGQRTPKGVIYFVHPVTQKLMRSRDGVSEVVEDPHNSVRWTTRFTFDEDGIGWLSGGGNIFRLEGLKVELLDASWGVPREIFLGNIVVDKQGTVWFGSSEGPVGVLYYLPRGTKRFQTLPEPVSCMPLAIAPDGSPWCSSVKGLAVVSVANGLPVSVRYLAKTSHGEFGFDRKGGAWITSRGVLKHVDDYRVLLESGGFESLEADRMTTKDGLSSDATWSILEDADGNVWMGTGAGLARFRSTRFTRVKLPRLDYGSAVLADADGSLWAGNWDGVLMHIVNGRIEDVPGLTQVTTLRRDNSGGIWVGGGGVVWRKKVGDTFRKVDGPPASSMPWLHQMAEDDSGAMWIQSANRLHRLQNGSWTKPEGPGIPPSDRQYVILQATDGQLWFFGNSASLYSLSRGDFREVKSQAYADHVSKSYAGYVAGARIWIGGIKGLAVLQGDSILPLKVKDGFGGNITGVVQTPQGDLWIHATSRAFRIPAEQVEAGLRGQTVVPETFDFRDGLQAATSSIEPRPTLVLDARGKLWFSTNQGLFWMDPQATPVVSPPPQPVIRFVNRDGNLTPAQGDLILPPNPSQIEFTYTAPAMSVKDRTRFRYRLEGVDDEWRDAGLRRTAYYTRLPPGRYRFEVSSSNARGDWHATPASLTFEVRPAWYQTVWFRSLVAVTLIGLAWFIYVLGMRMVAHRERERMRAISAERERIARDLHDTLLQSMQGVILGFQGLVNAYRTNDEARRSIETQLDRADRLLGEARDRVRDLRTTGPDALELSLAFELVASELESSVCIKVKEEGKRRLLLPLTHDRVYLIGREALMNAVAHGSATDIEVLLHFGARRFGLRVIDNGKGIDSEVLASGERTGHFGLVGMRERAQELHAAFTIRRGMRCGTEVSLEVPAARAYEIPSRLSWWQHLVDRHRRTRTWRSPSFRTSASRHLRDDQVRSG